MRESSLRSVLVPFSISEVLGPRGLSRRLRDAKSHIYCCGPSKRNGTSPALSRACCRRESPWMPLKPGTEPRSGMRNGGEETV